MVDYDVVVVGGGIAGSALAASLAPAGLSVLVLERLTEFRDRVRGEFMHPWGAAEMDRLDLTATLVAAGGNHNPSLVVYDEGQDPAAAAEIPLEMLVPGVGGSFHVGHPQASEALNVVAAERGATTQRGVSDVLVTAGRSPRVTYQLDGEALRRDVPHRRRGRRTPVDRSARASASRWPTRRAPTCSVACS